jgi:uncharacterized protein YdbL (DUF1318 family)
MLIMQKKIIFISLVVGHFLPVNAAAPLEAALTRGDVCERSDGFIQATPGNESTTAALVESVNADRAKEYAEIAARNGTDQASVGALYAKETLTKSPSRACR